jgi:hypothetical protein
MGEVRWSLEKIALSHSSSLSSVGPRIAPMAAKTFREPEPFKPDPVDPDKAPTLYFLSEQAQADGRMLGGFAQLLDDPDTEALGVSMLKDFLPAQEANREILYAKANSAVWAVQSLRASAFARKEQAARLTALAGVDTRAADRLEQYIVDCMIAADPEATSFALRDHKILSRKGDTLLIDDDAKIPSDLMRVKDPEPDKTAIRAALKAGTVIEGVSLLRSRIWRLA